MNNEATAKPRNTKAPENRESKQMLFTKIRVLNGKFLPIKVTTRTLIFLATRAPHMTAIPVQMQCPEMEVKPHGTVKA